MKKERLLTLLIAISIVFSVSCKKEDAAAKKAVKLFYTEYNDSLVGAIDLVNGNTNSLLATAANGLGKGLGAIVYYDKNNTLYATLEDDEEVISISSTGTVTVLYNSGDGLNTPTAIAVNPVNNKLYIAIHRNILVGNLDGSGTLTPLFAGGKGPSYGYCLVLDPDRNKIYFSDFDYGSTDSRNAIYVGNLDGTGDTSTLYRNVAGVTGLTWPSSFAIDPGSNKIYWADEYEDNIVSANLDGTGNYAVLFDSPTDGVDRSDGLAIDPASGKIFWSETGSHRIRSGNIDGSGTPVTLFDGSSLELECYGITLRFE